MNAVWSGIEMYPFDLIVYSISNRYEEKSLNLIQLNDFCRLYVRCQIKSAVVPV